MIGLLLAVAALASDGVDARMAQAGWGAVDGAEPAALEGPALTLEEALALARLNHPTGRIVGARIEQARANQLVVRSDLLPSLTGVGTYTRRPREVRVDGADAIIQARHALRATGSLFIPVFDLQGYQAMAAAGTGVAASEQEADVLRRQLGFTVADAYLVVLAGQQVLDAAQRRAALAAQVVEAARLRLNAGVATRNDLTRTELEQATAQLEVVVATGAVGASREVLAALIGVDAVGPLTDPELTPPPDDPPQRPDLAALELRAEQARQDARALTYGYVPTLGAFGGATATNEAGFLRRQYDWNVGAQATWSAFDGGRRLAAASRSRAVARELEATADDLRVTVRQDLETARVDLVTADAAFQVARGRAEVAARNADEVRERFSQGLATALEVSDAAASAFEAEAAVVRQRYERKRAALAVAEAMGAWPEAMLP